MAPSFDTLTEQDLHEEEEEEIDFSGKWWWSRRKEGKFHPSVKANGRDQI